MEPKPGKRIVSKGGYLRECLHKLGAIFLGTGLAILAVVMLMLAVLLFVPELILLSTLA